MKVSLIREQARSRLRSSPPRHARCRAVAAPRPLPKSPRPQLLIHCQVALRDARAYQAPPLTEQGRTASPSHTLPHPTPGALPGAAGVDAPGVARCREERYVRLLRFASLVEETLPRCAGWRRDDPRFLSLHRAAAAAIADAETLRGDVNAAWERSIESAAAEAAATEAARAAAAVAARSRAEATTAAPAAGDRGRDGGDGGGGDGWASPSDDDDDDDDDDDGGAAPDPPPGRVDPAALLASLGLGGAAGGAGRHSVLPASLAARAAPPAPDAAPSAPGALASRYPGLGGGVGGGGGPASATASGTGPAAAAGPPRASEPARYPRPRLGSDPRGTAVALASRVVGPAQAGPTPPAYSVDVRAQSRPAPSAPSAPSAPAAPAAPSGGGGGGPARHPRGLPASSRGPTAQRSTPKDSAAVRRPRPSDIGPAARASGNIGTTAEGW